MTDDATPPDLTDVETLADGMLSDYIAGNPVKDTPVERVRQRIAKAMIHEYGFDLGDLERDYTVAVDDDGRKRRKKVEIAIFTHKKPHTLDHLSRVILCRPEPKASKKAVTILRDHQQAEKDLRELKEIMEAVTPCMYGLWTNGLDVFFLHKNPSRFGSSFEPTTDWPTADNTQGTLSVLSFTQLRQADEDMLRLAFRRCHNFIHGNEGMPKDAAFWQFLYLIFSKMYDERLANEAKLAKRQYERQFVAYPAEVYPPEQKDGRELTSPEREQVHRDAQARLKKRIEGLFDKVKELNGPSSPNPLFQGNEAISLSPRALAFLVAELARYELSRTDIDAKGVAYQELVGANLRGDRGQYFTPRGARRLMVEILDPKEHERVFDPACGTGGFLKDTLSHLLRKMKEKEGTAGRPDVTEDFRNQGLRHV
jgi:type I restriction enzyme M protein